MKERARRKKESLIDSVTTHPLLLDVPSSHVRRPLQKLEMSSLLLMSIGKKGRGYRYEFSTPCPRYFPDDIPAWSKRTSRYPQACFLILENIKLPKCRNIFCSAAAAAKSLQSCLTLCDPTDGSPPGSSVPGILQARTLEWVAIAFSKYFALAYQIWIAICCLYTLWVKEVPIKARP